MKLNPEESLEWLEGYAMLPERMVTFAIQGYDQNGKPITTQGQKRVYAQFLPVDQDLPRWASAAGEWSFGRGW